MARFKAGLAFVLGLACFFTGLGAAVGLPFMAYLAYANRRGGLYPPFRVATQFGLVGVPEWTIAAVVAIGLLGGLALLLTRGSGWARVSLPASARRFAAWGLGFDAIAAGIVISALAYRWYLWG
jgi:hypothetical protein